MAIRARGSVGRATEKRLRRQREQPAPASGLPQQLKQAHAESREQSQTTRQRERLGVSKARPSSALSQAQQAEPEVDEFLARCAQRCAQDAKAAEQAPETETPEAENEPGTCQRHWIELTALPAVFRSATVEKMCRRYGDISGPYRDDKTDGQFRVGYLLREIATTAVKDLNGRFAAKGIPARAKFLPNSTTEKQKVFVDELLVGRGCAIKGWETDREADQRRELFFWNLPDLTPAKLFLWLQGGSKQDLDSRAPIELFESHEWRKCSYVRFQTHESALRTLQHIPQRDEKCQGAWSFSERLFAWREILRGIVQEAESELQCEALQLLGDGLGQRLCFEWNGAADDLPAIRLGLKDRLRAALESAMEKPCVLVHGLARSWTERDLKVLFALYGGTSTVTMAHMAPEKSKASCFVQMKDGAMSEKFVEHWDGKHVGDDDSGLERCQISCQLVPASRIPQADQKVPASHTGPGPRNKTNEGGLSAKPEDARSAQPKTPRTPKNKEVAKGTRTVFVGSQGATSSKAEPLPDKSQAQRKYSKSTCSTSSNNLREVLAKQLCPSGVKRQKVKVRAQERGRERRSTFLPDSEASLSVSNKTVEEEINRCFDNYNALLAKPVVRGDDLDEFEESIQRLGKSIEVYMRKDNFDRHLVDKYLKDGERFKARADEFRQKAKDQGLKRHRSRRKRPRKQCSESRSVSQERTKVVLKPRGQR